MATTPATKSGPNGDIDSLSRRLFPMLIAQFFLGMALNVIGKPDSNTPHLQALFAHTLFWLHVLNAVGLVIVGSLTLSAAGRHTNPKVKKLANQGLGAIVFAFIAGILTITTPWDPFFSFLMATGFLGALINVGRIYYELRTPGTPS